MSSQTKDTLLQDQEYGVLARPGVFTGVPLHRLTRHRLISAAQLYLLLEDTGTEALMGGCTR